MADATVLEGDARRFLDDAAVPLVQAYFSPSFTGSRFEAFAGGGDRADAWDRFDASDVVAVSMLGVEIDGRAALEILERRTRPLNQLLAEIPRYTVLEESSEALIGDGSAAECLWNELIEIPGLGWVTTSKLLARKRPALLPVLDGVVKAALQPNRSAFWVPLRNELVSDRGLVDRLAEIREQVGDSARHVSVIRILDVAVWMRNQGNVRTPVVDVAPLPFERRTDGRWIE